MNCFIKAIIVLNSEGDKRVVDLEPGLNIITGDSKTGKSALIEIVDYCLCSKVSNIPRGIISQFGSIFSIVLMFPSKQLVIGRKSYNSGGATKMYFSIETTSFSTQSIDNQYFDTQTPLQFKQAQLEIERHLGLSVTNMSDGDEGEHPEVRKASLRDIATFLFQHQNLIANKHSLFYRFDDYRKRQSVIDSFPIFSGWANDKYFFLKRLRERKERELKTIQNRANSSIKFLSNLEQDLKGYLKNYFFLIERPFDDKQSIYSYLNVRDERNNIVKTEYVGGGIDAQYSRLNATVDENKTKIASLSRNIKKLEESESYAIGFQVNLSDLRNRYFGIPQGNSTYECPTCGIEHHELSKELESLALSNEKVQVELNQLANYTVSYAKEIEELSNSREILRRENSLLIKQISDIEKTYELINKEKNLSNAIIYAKAQLDVRIDMFNENAKDSRNEYSQRLSDLQNELYSIDAELSQYNVDRFYSIAQTLLSADINRIGDKLDFEEQLKPLNLWFDLRTFTLTQTYGNAGTITLSEMGSGANWLTCHLALFLGLLKWFATESKSVVPSILFLDQPSQVYFPKEFDATKDEDIKQVSTIFITILEEIDLIYKIVGYKPQVIVSDHADNLNLGAYKFSDYVRKRWTPNHDKALI